MDTRYILVLAAVVILGWFAVGIIYNLRRGESLLRWMQGGLPLIGERTTFRWLGSSVAELVIERAKSPFRRLETLVILAPRDVPFMWLWALAIGRRDTLILRSNLQSAPKIVLELVDPAAWTGRQALQEVVRDGWESSPALTTIPVLAARGEAIKGLRLMAPQGRLSPALAALPSCLSIIDQFSPRFTRLSVRRDPPSLEVHLPFPNPRKIDAGEFFESFKTLGKAVCE
ncbi:MAG TPA: hypothetical protein VGA61_10875 [Anaerolineae bacterium]